MKRFLAVLATVGFLVLAPALAAHAEWGEEHGRHEANERNVPRGEGMFWPGFALGTFWNSGIPTPVYMAPLPPNCYALQEYWTPDGNGSWQWVPGQTVCQ